MSNPSNARIIRNTARFSAPDGPGNRCAKCGCPEDDCICPCNGCGVEMCNCVCAEEERSRNRASLDAAREWEWANRWGTYGEEPVGRRD